MIERRYSVVDKTWNRDKATIGSRRGISPPVNPIRALIGFPGYSLAMKKKLNVDLKAALMAAIKTPPTTIETVRKIRIKHINGVKVVLQEAEMVCSMN